MIGSLVVQPWSPEGKGDEAQHMLVDNAAPGVEGAPAAHAVLDDVFAGDKAKVGLEAFVHVNDVRRKIPEAVIIGDGCLGGEITLCNS